MSVTDDHMLHASSDSERSLSPPWNDSIELPTGNRNIPQTSTPIKAMDQPLSSSEESQSIGEESSVPSPDSGTVSSPDISLLTPNVSTQIEPDTDSYQEKSSDVHPDTPCDEHSQNTQPRPGYKIVIDNIDKNVRPRHMSIDSQTKSLHCVQLYCVKDRVKFGSLPDVPPSGEKQVYDILPTTEEYGKLKDNFAILVARKMTEHLLFFSEDFKGFIQRNIPHKYSREMSEKSEVVSHF